MTQRKIPRAQASGRPSAGGWLKRQREIAGKKQTEVAAYAGISPVHLSRIETGVGGTTQETLIAICDYIGADRREALEKFDMLPKLHDPSASMAFNKSEFGELWDDWQNLSSADQLELKSLLEYLKKEARARRKKS